ncbi:unnamed protein product [Lota lota]
MPRVVSAEQRLRVRPGSAAEYRDGVRWLLVSEMQLKALCLLPCVRNLVAYRAHSAWLMIKRVRAGVCTWSGRSKAVHAAGGTCIVSARVHVEARAVFSRGAWRLVLQRCVVAEVSPADVLHVRLGLPPPPPR